MLFVNTIISTVNKYHIYMIYIYIYISCKYAERFVILIWTQIFQNLKVATNATTYFHETICTWVARVHYNHSDQQFNRLDFR